MDNKKNNSVFVFENRKANPKKVGGLNKVKKGNFFFMEDIRGNKVIDKEGTYIYKAKKDAVKIDKIWTVDCKAVA